MLEQTSIKSQTVVTFDFHVSHPMPDQMEAFEQAWGGSWGEVKDEICSFAIVEPCTIDSLIASFRHALEHAQENGLLAGLVGTGQPELVAGCVTRLTGRLSGQ